MTYKQKNDAILDLAEAMRFREVNPLIPDHNEMMPVADLSVYTRATPDGLEYLAKQGYNSFAFIGLESLDNNNAGALAAWDAFLIFLNIQHLDTEVASILVAGCNQLAFERLMIGVEVARELARLNSLLALKLDSLSIEVAIELARHPHEMDLSLKIPPSDQVLDALCGHAGYRLSVSWERPPGNLPRDFLSSNPNKAILSPNQKKKVFMMPKLIKETGQWFENVYIGNTDFYPDSPISDDGIITLL